MAQAAVTERWPYKVEKMLKNQLFFVKKLKLFVLHISSSYAKILGETNFHTREIPRSRSKAKDGEKKKKRRD